MTPLREISAAAITDAVARLFMEANYGLGPDVIAALEKARDTEESPAGREVLATILENARVAGSERIPLCQDCGAAVVFLELGQDVHVTGGDLTEAVNEGVRRAYDQGFLRKSMVAQPFSARRNTGDNTPAVIHTDIVPGDRLKITVLPKGGGAENMARLGMLLPAAGRQGIIDFVVQTVDEASSKPCPPVIVGVGVGGTADKVMALAKHALVREVGAPGQDAEVAALERDILRKINDLGIGPMGYGGGVTALAVHVETFPTHITSLPVAVNLQCHSARHRSVTL
jgi:fumarate hydratase subunit alpha